MHKVLISIPDQLAVRMRIFVPARQRSKIIANLIEKEVTKRERELYNIALAVEKDEALSKEMQEWDITLDDGLNNESW
jgi:hypothetical protein